MEHVHALTSIKSKIKEYVHDLQHCIYELDSEVSSIRHQNESLQHLTMALDNELLELQRTNTQLKSNNEDLALQLAQAQIKNLHLEKSKAQNTVEDIFYRGQEPVSLSKPNLTQKNLPQNNNKRAKVLCGFSGCMRL